MQTTEKVKKTAAAVKSETKKAVNKAAQKAPKAKKTLKRMVSEIDAQAASKALLVLHSCRALPSLCHFEAAVHKHACGCHEEIHVHGGGVIPQA